MTSKISFYSILKEDLRRRIWMLAFSVLAGFVTMPITFLLANRTYLNRVSNTQPKSLVLQECYVEFFHSYGAVFQGIILGVGALIVAVWGFRHLYSRKMTDLYHSVPVRREKLFLATYLNGLLIWLLPMLTATAATLLIALGNLSVFGYASLSGPVIQAALKLIILSIAGFLSVYHFALVCVMLSGNAVNALFLMAILGCGTGAFYVMGDFLCDTFLDTYAEAILSIDHVIWTSPLVGPFRLMADFASRNTGALFWDISESDIVNPLFFRICSLLLIFWHFVLALLLYRRRPSELAEHGVDHRIMQVILRFCTGILSALFGVLIFLWLVDRHAFAWQMFGLLFCGTLGFGITDIIMQMNFKAFFQHKLQMLLSLAFSTLVLTTVFFDLTGFDHRLPDKEQIQSAAVVLSHYKDPSHSYEFEDQVIISTRYGEDKFYTDLDTIYPLLDAITGPERTNQSEVGRITVKLKTALGPFCRTYQLQAEDATLVRPIVESQEYLNAFYPASMGLLPLPITLDVESRLDYSRYSTNRQEEIEAILDAYQEDFAANSTLETLNTGHSAGSLELTYPYAGSGSSLPHTYSFSLELYTHYTKTLAIIQEYYPEFPLSLEELSIASIELYPADLLSTPIFGFDTLTVSRNYEKDEIWNHLVIMDDPQEIAALLPYLTAAYNQEGMFSLHQEFYYLGQARLRSGNSLSLLVPESSLPLPVTDSIQEFLSKLPNE